MYAFRTTLGRADVLMVGYYSVSNDVLLSSKTVESIPRLVRDQRVRERIQKSVRRLGSI